MPLIEEMERQGNWLFRWRSYLPLFAGVLVLVGLQHFTYPIGSHRLDQAWELVCLAVSLLGLGVRVAVVGFTPRKTSGRNTQRQVASSLNTTGVYSVVRNPLYLGNFIVGLGLSLFLREWWVPVIYALVFMIYYERIILAEEMFLRQKFGQQYTDWASKTNVFLPRFHQWVPPIQRFNVRQVVRREHQTLFGIIMLFFILEVTSELRLGHFEFDDMMWNVLAAVAAVFFIVIRVLRTFTTVLKDRETELVGQPTQTMR
jgi:protein-S-isoprenylcysteine O-methyltransferase Ste14